MLETFRQCCRPLTANSQVKPTNIYPTRLLADTENRREFENLETPIHVYAAIDSRDDDDDDVLRDLHAAKRISMRVGAQVMLLANLNVREGLVNGTRGIITGFVASNEEIHKYAVPPQHNPLSESAASPFETLPKVLFETKDGNKQVAHPYPSLVPPLIPPGHPHPLHLDHPTRSPQHRLKNTNPITTSLGVDVS
jgi:hypothetical protein